MIHNSEWCHSPSFLSYIKLCPITCYWSDIALHQMGRQHQFISSYWISANINGYLARVLLKHLSAITELMNRLASFVCERGGEGIGKKKKCANPACEFVLIPGTDRTRMALCMCTFFSHNGCSGCMLLSDMLTFCTAHCLFFIDNQVNN